MNDGDALLRAVIADPEDDVVRLVYADWLEEQGERKRAVSIRKMVAAPDGIVTVSEPAPGNGPQLRVLSSGVQFPNLGSVCRRCYFELSCGRRCVLPWVRIKKGFVEEIEIHPVFVNDIHSIRKLTPLKSVTVRVHPEAITFVYRFLKDAHPALDFSVRPNW